ncbi:MAG: hypothetical protein QM689_06735 [Oscillospiraceae bacterium]
MASADAADAEVGEVLAVAEGAGAAAVSAAVGTAVWAAAVGAGTAALDSPAAMGKVRIGT